ncbi:transglycosylase SLT domain-containing protein [Magnetococcales bacterium HHB-1]
MLPVLLAGCATRLPTDLLNACTIFREKPEWFPAVRATEKKWRVPISLQLAIIYQESRFRQDAKPPRWRLLGFIPWKRASSAFGYSQALDATWDWYKKSTGRHNAERDRFDDAVDFIGWYLHVSHKQLKISKTDGYRQYLAYHEGQGGYRRKTYLKKKWLMRIAKKVARIQRQYHVQLKGCQSQFESERSIWPFF